VKKESKGFPGRIGFCTCCRYLLCVGPTPFHAPVIAIVTAPAIESVRTAAFGYFEQKTICGGYQVGGVDGEGSLDPESGILERQNRASVYARWDPVDDFHSSLAHQSR
jgi:hypothetical protein